MAREEKIDLCVIGAGQAGIAAAMEAAALGASVALVKNAGPDENALLWGALATQAFAASANRAHAIRNAKALGIGADEPRINFARLNARVKEVVSQARPDLSTERLTALGIDVIDGHGAFDSPSSVKVGDRIIRARRFIVATGSRPAVPDIPGLSEAGYYTPDTIFEISRKPSHLVVLGGGGTGLALAQAHLRLGCQVTLIDMLEPLGDIDPELTRVVVESLEHEGLAIHANSGIVSIGTTDEAITIATKSGAEEIELVASHLLVATGRIANVEGLGLENAKVKFGRHGPVLNSNLRSSNRKIFFIDEGRGADQSVHAARTWARQLAGGGSADRRPVVPVLVHTDPQILQIGVSEPQARKRLVERYAITRAPFAQTDRARAEGHLTGYVKLITHASGKIIGAGIVGDNASELAAVFALAIGRELSPDQLDAVVAPYPAYGQVIADLCAQYGRANPPSRAKQRLARLKRLLPW